MKIEKAQYSGLAELYKYVDSVKNTEYGKSQFRNHLGNFYYSVSIHLTIKDMNILELIYAKKMYDENIMIENLRMSDKNDDADYQELLDSCDDTKALRDMPLFFFVADAYVTITGPLVLGILSTDKTFDPVGFLYDLTNGACFSKDGNFLPNISKYTKDIEERIKVNFVNGLYSYMYKMIFDGDLLSDYGIEKYLFTSNDKAKIVSIETFSDTIEVTNKDILESMIEKLKDYKKDEEVTLREKRIKDSTFFNFSVKGTIGELFRVYTALPVRCITNVTPFMVMINKDNQRIENSENKFDKLILSKYQTNLLRRTVCLPWSAECDFTLRISFTDALSFLTYENRKADSDILNYIYNIIKSFYSKIF